MFTIKRTKLAFVIPLLIFATCVLITYTGKYKQHPDTFSLAILIDMLIVAPLFYLLATRKTAISKFSALRVCMAGIVLAGFILAKNNSEILAIIKTWVAPLIELTLIGLIVWKFYSSGKKLSKTSFVPADFMLHCRTVLQIIFGNEKAASIIASEVAVFYYTFNRKRKLQGNCFTSYKKNGTILILATFLCLFIIETTGMHFVFLLWNKTAAWILTGLSLYTCMQLFAHIRSLKTRPTVIGSDYIFLCNGLLGGDAIIERSNIEKIIQSNKQPEGPGVVKMAFISGLEKHNLVIHLKEAVQVTKAFGIQKMAKTILINIDNHERFLLLLECNSK